MNVIGINIITNVRSRTETAAINKQKIDTIISNLGYPLFPYIGHEKSIHVKRI